MSAVASIVHLAVATALANVAAHEILVWRCKSKDDA